jgi:DNA-binding NarL/FixJ family response regulator
MLAKEGMAVEDIARRLDVSRRFVKSHVVALLRKHGVVRHDDLIALSRRLYVELAA